MNSRIIYRTDDGGVAIIIPAAECGLTVDSGATVTVPDGSTWTIA